MKVYGVYILNKAGGLLYQRDFDSSLQKLNANEYLVLASTLHGVHAIASKLTPNVSSEGEGPPKRNAKLLATGKSQDSNNNYSGLQSIETDFFNLFVFQTLTGVKFILVTSPNPVVHNIQPLVSQSVSSKGELEKQKEEADQLYRRLYVIYADYVMKDPFYTLDMPIKGNLFDQRVCELFK